MEDTRVELTLTELSFIQYICECIAFDTEIDINEQGVKIANRLGQITSNLILSDDNQVEVDERLPENGSPLSYVIERNVDKRNRY